MTNRVGLPVPHRRTHNHSLRCSIAMILGPAALLPVLLITVAGIAGCQQEPTVPQGTATTQGVIPTFPQAAEQEFAKLSPQDAAQAKRQYICPVSSELLGTMGPPQRVEVLGRVVWTCCDACREKLLAEPAQQLTEPELYPLVGEDADSVSDTAQR